MPEGKSIFASKTVWFNVITTVVGVIMALQSMPTFEMYAPLMGMILTVGNVILRVWFTSQPIQ